MTKYIRKAKRLGHKQELTKEKDRRSGVGISPTELSRMYDNYFVEIMARENIPLDKKEIRRQICTVSFKLYKQRYDPMARVPSKVAMIKMRERFVGWLKDGTLKARVEAAKRWLKKNENS